MSELLANVTCVSIGGRGLLIDGPSGSGKSSLALALIDRGAILVGDDGLAVEERDGRVIASPPPEIAGKLEIRNVGLVDVPCAEAPLALAVRLDPGAPRYIDEAATATVVGCTLPLVSLWPDAPQLPLRAEWALRQFGIA